MKQSVRRIPLVLGAAALLLGAAAPAAQAQTVNRYTIQANSPKPAACNNSGTIAPGTWIQNKVCGYFVGTAMAGSSFDVQETASSDYHFGRNYGNNNLCGWIPPGALSSSPTGTATASCSDATRSAMAHRLTVGHDFNAVAHDATDGTAITVNPGCGAFYNYFTASSYDSGSLRDAAGTPSSTVQYRYTTNTSSPAMVVRDSALGWVFMSRSCVTDWRGITFHNDND